MTKLIAYELVRVISKKILSTMTISTLQQAIIAQDTIHKPLQYTVLLKFIFQ